MSLDEFKRIVEKTAPFAGVSLHNGGEPTLNPDLPAMTRWLASNKLASSVRIVSNGVARPLDFYKELFDNGLTSLEISVDTLSESLVDSLRAGTDVRKLAENLKALCSGFKATCVRTTVSRINLETIDTLLLELRDLGVKRVFFQPLESRDPNPEILSLPECMAFAKRMAVLQETLGLKLDFSQFEMTSSFCPAPMRSPNITVDGHMTPCCNIPFREDYDYGDILSSSFDAVWNSSAAVAFREKSANGFHKLCSHCASKRRREMFELYGHGAEPHP